MTAAAMLAATTPTDRELPSHTAQSRYGTVSYIIIDMTHSADDIIIIPYLPVLGPVHPSEVRDELLQTLFTAGDTLLPYDKNSRWSDKPTEKVIEYSESNSALRVSTKTSKSRNMHYVYTDGRETVQTDVPYEDGGAEMVTFSRSVRGLREGERGTVLFMDTFSVRNPTLDLRGKGHIHTFSDLSPRIRDGFAKQLGDDPALRGLDIAITKDRETPGEFPVLVYVENDDIVGAIGPLNILEDSLGVKRLLPSYFIVSPHHRKQGIGTCLWNAMRSWAIDNGAGYTVLQAELNGAAAQFYNANGLQELGYVYKSEIIPKLR